jgi:hypothetical protein
MRSLPFFADPQIREDILDHLSGFVFDRALVRNDEPMRAPRYTTEREAEQARWARSTRSARR